VVLNEIIPTTKKRKRGFMRKLHFALGDKGGVEKSLIEEVV
jgi:hypothetical protein